jgi:hypothetical protein
MTQPTRQIQPDPSLLLTTAVRLAAAGTPVFPCAPDAKNPLTRHGLLDATTDPGQIRAWWARTPDANLAIPTGTASHDVLDVDVRPAGSGFPAFNRLVREGLVDGHQRVIATPSGGLHAYFPGSDQPSSRLPGHHLDFKANGGYVLTPPSVVGGRPYELVRRSPGPHQTLDWTAIRNLLSPNGSQPARTPCLSGPPDIQHLASWVARLPEGQRNAGTFWAACRAVEQGIVDLRPLVDAAIQAGLPRREAARTVSSAVRRITAPITSKAATSAPGRRHRAGPGM